MKSYWEAFLRLIYPAACAVCETLLELHDEGLCGACLARLEALRFAPEEAALHEHFEAVDEGWALYPYESPAREILSDIKFSKKRWLMRVFRRDLEPLATAITAENHYDVLIPVPIDRQKLLTREFNQSEIAAGLLSRSTRIPLAAGILKKKSATPSQSHLSREERLVNLTRAFQLREGAGLQGKSVLLVDDIVTTGATAEEAARTLKAGGARRVDLFAIARAGDGR